MKQIQKMIPAAMDAVNKYIKKDGVVNSKFNGYISSFGASIISAGILPTLVFFSQKGDAKADRTKIIPALEMILEKENKLDVNEKLIIKVKKLIDNNNDIELEFLTENILNAVIALKLAIRTFKQEKEDKEKDKE